MKLISLMVIALLGTCEGINLKDLEIQENNAYLLSYKENKEK